MPREIKVPWVDPPYHSNLVDAKTIPVPRPYVAACAGPFREQKFIPDSCRIAADEIMGRYIKPQPFKYFIDVCPRLSTDVDTGGLILNLYIYADALGRWRQAVDAWVFTEIKDYERWAPSINGMFDIAKRIIKMWSLESWGYMKRRRDGRKDLPPLLWWPVEAQWRFEETNVPYVPEEDGPSSKVVVEEGLDAGGHNDPTKR